MIKTVLTSKSLEVIEEMEPTYCYVVIQGENGECSNIEGVFADFAEAKAFVITDLINYDEWKYEGNNTWVKRCDYVCIQKHVIKGMYST